jgi:hypothetical protein
MNSLYVGSSKEKDCHFATGFWLSLCSVFVRRFYSISIKSMVEGFICAPVGPQAKLGCFQLLDPIRHKLTNLIFVYWRIQEVLRVDNTVLLSASSSAI